MKIYISGLISGDEKHAEKLFQQKETELLAQGFEVVNPFKLDHNHDKRWDQYLKVDIKALMDCDLIYMLNSWRMSKGAKLEHELAMKLGFGLVYEEDPYANFAERFAC